MKSINRRSFLTLAGAVPLGLSLSHSLHAESADAAGEVRQIFIQTAKGRQVIEHFGASDCWTIDPVGKAWSKENKERLADLLFSRDKGIGLSLWRFNLGAGDANPEGYANAWRNPETMQSAPDAPIDGTKQSGQQWFLKAAKQRGVEKTLAFVNSPPIWLTKNGRAFTNKDEKGTNLKLGSERAFGKYLVDLLRYFEKQGLPFDYVSPVNEPNWRWNGGQEGCSYNVGEMRRTTLAVAEELQAAKSPVRICLGELGDYRALLDDADYRTYGGITKETVTYGGGGRGGTDGANYGYLSGVFSDAEIRKILNNTFLAHSYWSDGSPHDLAELRTQVRVNFDRYAPGGQFWQSEYCVMEHKRDYGMDMALRVASVIHHDLACAEVNSWSWWTALSQVDYKDGLVYTDYKVDGSGEQNILPSKTLWALGNWSRFVRPGAQRVETMTDALPDDLMVTAYVSANRRDLIVTLINSSTTTIPAQLGMDRIVREFTPYVTDATRDLHRESSVSATKPIPIPARSVVTLVGRLGDSTTVTVSPTLSRPTRRKLVGGKYLYAVQCGFSDTERGNDAQCNSRADMPFGSDPGTGFSWGYRTYGKAGGHRSEKGVPTESVRLDEGDTAGQGITYRFEVEPNRALSMEIGWLDPWNNPNRRMDVIVQGQTVEKAIVPGQQMLTRSYPVTSSKDGVVELQVIRSADNADPGADPLVSYIRIQ